MFYKFLIEIKLNLKSLYKKFKYLLIEYNYIILKLIFISVF